MKRRYERPSAYIEEFTPNEYVAACGDNNEVYKFECDAPRGWLYYYPKEKKDGFKLLGSYHPCQAKHEASTKDAFYDGFVDYNYNRREDKGEAVKVWRGPKQNNGHATTKLNMDTWATAKS